MPKLFSLGGEFKSAISETTIDEFSGADTFVTTCIVGEKSFLEPVPEKFIGQILCQMLVTRTNFCVLVISSEIGMLEIVVIHCSVFYLNEALKETEKKSQI